MSVSKPVKQYLSKIGRKGGSSTSPKKAAASRKNGLLAHRKKDKTLLDKEFYL